MISHSLTVSISCFKNLSNRFAIGKIIFETPHRYEVQIKCFDVGQPREVRVMSVLDAFVRKTLFERRRLTHQEHISMHSLS